VGLLQQEAVAEHSNHNSTPSPPSYPLDHKLSQMDLKESLALVGEEMSQVQLQDTLGVDILFKLLGSEKEICVHPIVFLHRVAVCYNKVMPLFADFMPVLWGQEVPRGEVLCLRERGGGLT
jgi:hypothetical protein